MTAKPKPRKPRPKSKRKQGAQPGNKNNLRHGFYSKQFTPDENKRLIGQKDDITVIAEIDLIRVCLDRLNQEISFAEVSYMDNNGNQLRNDHYLQQLNTLSAMTQSLSTLIRTHYLTHGKSGDIQSSILTALEELRLEMGL
jgi:hypothetical protein